MDRRIVMADNYSVHELPPVDDGGALAVNFSVNLRNILGVNEKDQLISLETSLRMFWHDPRVKVREGALRGRDYISLNPRVTCVVTCTDAFILLIQLRNYRRLLASSGFRTYFWTAPATFAFPPFTFARPRSGSTGIR